MRTVYDDVAGTRPKIRRDVLFSRTPDGVLFHNASSGFRIASAVAYRLAAILVPHLNGTNLVADLCARLPAAHREMVGELIGALYARGFARDVPAPDNRDGPALPAAVADRFAAQIGYIDHYVDDAPRRFAAFRSTVVAVLGTGMLAEACAAGLIRNGIAEVRVCAGAAQSARREAAAVDGAATVTEIAAAEPGWAELAGAEVVLVAGGAAAARRVHRLLAAGLPAGVSLLAAWRYGDRAVIGPLMEQGRTGCWCCAMLRLGTNGDPRVAAAIWSGIALPADPVVPLPGNPISGPLAAMLGNLLAYEVFRFTTGALPAETAGQVLVQNIESLDVLAEPLLPHPRCPYCVAQPTEFALDPLSWPAGEASTLTDPSGAASTDPGEAAVAELTARSILVQPHVGVFTGFADEEFLQTPVKVGAVEFTDATGNRRLVTAFDLQHVAAARRRAIHDAVTAYTGQLAVTAPAGAGLVRATSLLTGATGTLPAAAVEPFGAANRDRAVEPTRCGGGAGADLGEAVRHGLASALAYRALTRAVWGAVEVRTVPLDDIDGSPELVFLRKSAANLGAAVELLELVGDPLMPVFLARCPDPAGNDPLWTVAAGPGWHTAAARALTDLLGRVQLHQQPLADLPADGADPVLLDFAPATLRATGTATARAGTGDGWAGVSAALARAGLDAWVAVVSGADLAAAGLVAVRVVLTGDAGGAAR